VPLATITAEEIIE
jgi:hypothetical protein